MVACLLAGVAFLARTCILMAADVRVIEPSERIDANEITRVFSDSPAMPRTRSIRKVPTASGPAAGIALRIQFALNSAAIPPEALKQLDAIAAGLRAVAGAPRIEIEGHTDASGSDSYNDSLSLRRAQSVRSYLVSRGVTPGWLETRGLGRSALLNKDDPLAAENRRVEFLKIP
jgi:outer membrane protein OmpA-like peptidoglycan-associated protein